MFVKKILPLFLLCALLAGCAQTAAEGMAEVPVETSAETQEEAYTAQTELVEIELEDEAVALAASPAAQSTLLLPEPRFRRQTRPSSTTPTARMAM